MGTPVTICSAPIEYATNDGRILRLSGQIQASMSLSIADSNPPDDEDSFPWTVLAATFKFADKDGCCWQITSRFGSELLIRTLMDFSSMNRISPWNNFSSKEKKDFETQVVLQDIWFSSDDRFVRPLIVGESVKEVQFKYFGISFDLAIFPNTIDQDLHLPHVLGRTTSPMFDYKVEKLPSLCFPIDWRYFLVNTYCMKNGASYIPIPFVAELTDCIETPQANVVVHSTT